MIKRLEGLFWVALIFGATYLLISVRTETVNATYEYVKIEKQLKIEEQSLQNLRVEWLRLTSPKHLQALSRRLGLQAPTFSQVIRYDPNETAVHAARVQ